MVPLDLLKQYLQTLDEIMLCELLDISSEDLIEAFEHKIKTRREYLEKEIELYGTEDGGLDVARHELKRPEDLLFENRDYDPDEWN